MRGCIARALQVHYNSLYPAAEPPGPDLGLGSVAEGANSANSATAEAGSDGHPPTPKVLGSKTIGRIVRKIR
jgi:hypothetical protein